MKSINHAASGGGRGAATYRTENRHSSRLKTKTLCPGMGNTIVIGNMGAIRHGGQETTILLGGDTVHQEDRILLLLHQTITALHPNAGITTGQETPNPLEDATRKENTLRARPSTAHPLVEGVNASLEKITLLQSESFHCREMNAVHLGMAPHPRRGVTAPHYVRGHRAKAAPGETIHRQRSVVEEPPNTLRADRYMTVPRLASGRSAHIQALGVVGKATAKGQGESTLRGATGRHLKKVDLEEGAHLCPERESLGMAAPLCHRRDIENLAPSCPLKGPKGLAGARHTTAQDIQAREWQSSLVGSGYGVLLG